MFKKEKYFEIIDKLLVSLKGPSGDAILPKVFYNTITLIENLYGKEDKRISNLLENKSKYFDSNPHNTFADASLRNSVSGILQSIKHDIENDLIFNIEKQTIGSVVADFVTLAKSCADENNKDVAAVLASAALEDSLKRFAFLSGLQVDDKEMPDVINALKGGGITEGSSSQCSYFIY